MRPSTRLSLRFAAVALATWVAAMDAASAQDSARKYQIAEQSLGQALREFALANNLDLLFSPDLVAGKKSPSLDGKFTVDEGLRTLLRGSGLEFSVSGSRVVISEAKETPARQAIAPTTSATNGTNGTNDYTRLAQVDTTYPSQGEGRSEVTASENEKTAQSRKVTELEEIVVTGSLIRGTSVAPVLSFDREDFERSSATNASDFLREVPQNFSGSVAETVTSTIAARAGDGSDNRSRSTSSDIRGLGAGSTLTLLNGKRLAPSGNGDFVDISLIPLGAIERIEVLPDGASSIYGSDAIAGVVNIILRERYDGAETIVGYGGTPEGGYDELRASQTLGASWQSGGILAAFDYRDTGALRSGERSVAANDRPEVTILAPTERQSLLIRTDQQIGDIDLFATALGSKRDADALDFSSNDTVTDLVSINAESVSFTVGAGAELGNNWRLEVSGTHSDSLSLVDVFSVQTNRRVLFRGESVVEGADFKFDGPLIELPAGPVRFALGGAYFNFETITSNTLTTTAGVSFRPAINMERDVSSLYAETIIPIVGESNAIPLVRRLDLDVSARVDRYSDVGDTTNPKVVLLWEPFEGLRFTGSWGTSFRAPDFNDLNIAPSYLLDTVPDPLSSTGNTTALIIGGVSDLSPETSESVNFTLRYKPSDLDSLELIIGYYKIDFEDRIAVPAVTWIDMFANPAAFAALINRNPTAADINEVVSRGGTFSNFTASRPGGLRSISDATAIADFSRQNVAETVVTGIDFSTRYSWDLAGGTLLGAISGTYVLDKYDRATSSAPPIDTFDRSYLPPELVLRASLSWATEQGSISVAGSYRQGYPDTYATTRGFPARDVEDLTTCDLILTGRPALFGLDNERSGFSARLLLRDVFDGGAPLVYGALAHQPNFDPANSDIRGRTVALELRKTW